MTVRTAQVVDLRGIVYGLGARESRARKKGSSDRALLGATFNSQMVTPGTHFSQCRCPSLTITSRGKQLLYLWPKLVVSDLLEEMTTDTNIHTDAQTCTHTRNRYTHMYTQTHTYIHTHHTHTQYIYTQHTHIHICTHIHTNIYTHIHTCNTQIYDTHIHIHTHMHMHPYTNIHLHTHIRGCVDI